MPQKYHWRRLPRCRWRMMICCWKSSSASPRPRCRYPTPPSSVSSGDASPTPASAGASAPATTASLPLLGLFFKGQSCISFTPTLEPHNRIPPDRFSLPLDNIDGWYILCCRHGLFLLLHRNPLQILVWDPLTGDLIHIDVPVGLDNLVAMTDSFDGAVLRSGAGKHFQVVLIRKDDGCTRVLACVYSSETEGWGNLLSTDCPSRSGRHFLGSNTLVGGSLYFLSRGNSSGVLVLDLGRSCLALIDVPSVVRTNNSLFCRIVAMNSGGLGFLYLLASRIQLWERKTGFDAVARWVIGGTVELDMLLSLDSVKHIPPLILEFFEDDNVLLLGFFMVQLESLQFKRNPKKLAFSFYHAFATVYTAGTECSGS